MDYRFGSFFVLVDSIYRGMAIGRSFRASNSFVTRQKPHLIFQTLSTLLNLYPRAPFPEVF